MVVVPSAQRCLHPFSLFLELNLITYSSGLHLIIFFRIWFWRCNFGSGWIVSSNLVKRCKCNWNFVFKFNLLTFTSGVHVILFSNLICNHLRADGIGFFFPALRIRQVVHHPLKTPLSEWTPFAAVVCGWRSPRIDSVHTRRIVKTSGFTRGVCKINRGFYKI